MPRLARLDAPGILHHVIGRGIDRKKIFFNDTDRCDFIDRLADLVAEGAMDVYAWVLMPNHYIPSQKLSTIGAKRGGIGATAGAGRWWISPESRRLVRGVGVKETG